MANPFLGVWRRQHIRFDQSPPETGRQVLWIQAETLFADVRSPWLAGPLTAAGYRTLDWRSRFEVDLTAFTGRFTWTPATAATGTVTWHHTLALTPRSFADSSHYRWLADDLFLETGRCPDEAGVSHPFEELWQRLHPGPVQVRQSNQGERQQLWFEAGTWAIAIQGQPDPPTLETALATFSAQAMARQGPQWQVIYRV